MVQRQQAADKSVTDCCGEDNHTSHGLPSSKSGPDNSTTEDKTETVLDTNENVTKDGELSDEASRWYEMSQDRLAMDSDWWHIQSASQTFIWLMPKFKLRCVRGVCHSSESCQINLIPWFLFLSSKTKFVNVDYVLCNKLSV